MSEPCDLSAVAARALIGAKKLSPVELVDSCIERIEQVDPAVNCMVARDFDRAREAARVAEHAVMKGEKLGALHGLPVGVKDLEETAGLRTTFGSPIFADHVPKTDDLHVMKIRKAGGIIIGKTNVPEWGAGANSRNKVYGVTGNPFDTRKSAAGSSGGSAVALATGMAALCTGSDTGGSLRNPAAFNGIVGFRPTQGLVPNPKRALGWTTNGTLGPMGRDVADTALLMSVMAGNHKGDPLATTIHGRRVQRPAHFYPARALDLSSLRVAFSPDLGFAPTEKHIRAVFAEKTEKFRTRFGEAVDENPDMKGADRAFEVGRAVGFLGKYLQWYRTRPDDLGPNLHANIEEGLGYTLEDFAAAHIEQTRIYHEFQNFFDRYDVLITPGITISPRDWAELYPAEIDGEPTRTYFHWLALSYGITLTGHPAICIPCGKDHAGMPFGLQIVGPRGGDAFVLNVALALEQAFADDAALARPQPDIAALKKAPLIRDMPGFFGFG